MKLLLNSIPSGARIVLVILLCVVLPSVILSVLAIRAIGTERARMQARVRRDALAATQKVVETTVCALTAARSEIAGQAPALGEGAPADGLLKKVCSACPCFEYVVLANRDGTVVYPPVPRSGTMTALGKMPAELPGELRKAQNLEFVQADLDGAAAAYREAHDSAAKAHDRVSALLGLARIATKQGDLRQAAELYRTLRDKYGPQRDENGLLVGPAAALRLAEMAFEKGADGELQKELESALGELENHRGELTREEADFLDARLTSLTESLIEECPGSPTQMASLRRVLDSVRERRRRESVAQGAGRLAGSGLFDERGLARYEHDGESFVGVGVPVTVAGSRLVAFALAPVERVERELVAPEVARLTPREDVGVVVTNDRGEVVAGERGAPDSFRLGGSRFPEPLSHLRAEAYLKGYESLAALSSWRTNIYVWAVVLAILGIIAGALVTYLSVRRTMRAAELKSDFVSNVTHELKTPLTSIRMFAETLYEGRVQDEHDSKECLETIVAESERLTHLIDRVLEFGAMEKGKRKFDFRVADLRKVVIESLRTFRRQMRAYEATVHVNIPHDLPRVRMDPDAIGGVLLNLLVNAYKYSRPRDRRIWVSAHVNKASVRVSVEDHGIGIPKRELKAIFGKFYRVDDTLTREVDGTGLGLTISRHVAEAHGGAIEVVSSVGKGSKFTLVLRRG